MAKLREGLELARTPPKKVEEKCWIRSGTKSYAANIAKRSVTYGENEEST